MPSDYTASPSHCKSANLRDYCQRASELLLHAFSVRTMAQSEVRQCINYQGLPHSVFKNPKKSKAALFSLMRDERLPIKDKLLFIHLISNTEILRM